MNNQKRLTLFCFSVLFSTAALADCVTRDATAKEIDFYKNTFAMLRPALAPAPEKWTLKVEPESKPVGGCKGEVEGKFSVLLEASYTYHPTKEESDRLYADYRKLEKDKENLSQLPPAIAKERQEWLDKMSVANRASNQAYKEGNKELVRQKDKESEEFSKKGREIRSNYLASVQTQLDAIQAKQEQIAYRDTPVLVRIVVNERFGYEGTVDPKRDTDIRLGKAKAPDNPGLKVHAIRLKLSGQVVALRAVVEGLVDKDILARITK
ncbi:MAG: hypothetical protein WCL29_04975 [Pseudomonadota bacterium]